MKILTRWQWEGAVGAQTIASCVSMKVFTRYPFIDHLMRGQECLIDRFCALFDTYNTLIYCQSLMEGTREMFNFLKSTRVSDWVIRGRRREATPARDVALMLAVQWQAVCTLRVRSDKTENPCPGLACFLIDSTIGDQMRMDISQIFVYIFIERND